jgi:hypothetical protein
MKARDQTAAAPPAVPQRTRAARAVVTSPAFANAVIPAVATDGPGAAAADEPNALRPVPINIPEEALIDLRQCAAATRWPDPETIRAVLGNDIAVKAYREGTLPFPEGSIVARIAWSYMPSEENNKVFAPALKQDVQHSFVAGPPTNGVQFMVKDSKQYAATGGWGYAHFNDGKPAGEAFLQSCYPCHQAIKSRDFVFTRYSP